MDSAERRTVEVVQKRRGKLTEFHGKRCQQPESPHALPDDVLTRSTPHERTPADQFPHEPVCSGKRQVGTAGKVAERQAPMLTIKSVQYREQPRCYGHPRRGTVS